MQTTNPFTLSISRYKEVQEAKKSVIYYIIEINKKDAENWRLEKRFKEFDELNSSLRKTYANLPHFPGKSVFALKEDVDIEKRRSELENYMQILVTRTDIMSSEVLKRFLELENFAPEMTATPPKLLADIQGLILGVRDFHYQVDEGLFFTCLSDMSVTSRVDSYLTNMKLPWKENNKSGLVTVGAVECYMQTGAQGELKFEKLWFKTFQVQVINIYWDQASCLLLIGKDDGTVTVLKVSSELNYIKYDEVVTTKLHQGRVMGIYIDSISEFIYSIAEDKKLKVYDLRKNEHVADIACGSSLLTVLYPDKENKRLFVSNRNGQIFLYDISSGAPKLVHIIQAHSKGAIRGMYFDAYRNYLLTGNYDDGTLALIDMQKPDRAKYSHIITHLKGRKKIRCVAWSSSKGEVYAGGEDGTVTFWDIKKSSPIFAMKCHTYGITKLQLINDSDILITGGKDNRLRFYKLPQEWIDKRLEPEALKIPEVPRDSEIQKITASVLESKRQTQRALDDSEDEPEGWAKGL